MTLCVMSLRDGRVFLARGDGLGAVKNCKRQIARAEKKAKNDRNRRRETRPR